MIAHDFVVGIGRTSEHAAKVANKPSEAIQPHDQAYFDQTSDDEWPTTSIIVHQGNDVRASCRGENDACEE